jgi:hypothetical protein
VHVGVAAVAKKPSAAEPNTVINELISSLIARALFLPIAPGALLEHSGDTYFFSMNFNLAGQALPPTNVPLLLSEQIETCWGILLFDILMMNIDRHANNLSYDTVTKDVQIFDHGRTFLSLSQTIDDVIANCKDKPGIANHCLQNTINSWFGFDLWVERIKALPNYFIECAVIELRKIGFPFGKVRAAQDFLKSRRDGIEDLVTKNMPLFPSLPPPPAIAPAAVPAPAPVAAPAAAAAAAPGPAAPPL